MAETVPFVDLAHDYHVVGDDVRERFDRILGLQCFVGGDQTVELESRLAQLTGAHAVACSSGSDALYLALRSAGIGPGDAVIVPAFTFFSTAGAVVRAGAVPVFADVDTATLMLGPRELEKTLSDRFVRDGERLVERSSRAPLAAAIVVHLFGRAAPVADLSALLAEVGRAMLVEDAAQAIGAGTSSGRVGAGELVCFSFYPTKNIGGAGDGGAVTTSSEARAHRIRVLRNHGAGADPYVHDECGINARIGELAAALVNAKLARLEEWTRARGRLAALYHEQLGGLERRGRLRRPVPAAAPECVWHQYTLRLPEGRDRVAASLGAAGVDTRIFYPLPLHLQPCFRDLDYRAGSLPESERAAADVLSLPIHPSLGEDAVARVCDALERALGEV